MRQRFEGALTAEEVIERNSECQRKEICYISQKPLEGQERFTWITNNGNFEVLSQYKEAISVK
jgi:hypothetical protein